MNKTLLTLVACFALANPALTAETRQFTDATGKTVEVPSAPERIVALHDLSLTVPLNELGLSPVGAVGRTGADGVRYLRGAKTLTGIDFDNSDIVDVGGFPADLEVVASLNPDLILMMHFNTTDRTQLEAVAPTIMLEDNMRGEFVVFDQLAALTGTEERLDVLKNRYQGQVAQIEKMIDTQDISVSVFGPSQDKLVAWHTYGALGKVLRDAGFGAPEIVNQIDGSERVYFSGEQIAAFDADFIITTYDHNRGESPQSIIDDLNAIVPDFCRYLTACREGRMIFLPREDAVTRSYEALGQMSAVIMGVIGGQGHTAVVSE